MKPGWRKGALSEYFETVTGNTPSKQNAAFYGDGVPLIKPPELTGGMLYEASDNLTQLGAQSARVLPVNSVLVSCIGNLGKIGMNAVPVAFNQQINAILPRPDLFDPRFTFYFTHSEMFSEQLEAGASGTTVAIVNKSRFNTIEIPLPPLDEQKRIVEVLDAAFEGLSRARAHTETNLQNARELFEGYLANLFAAPPKNWTVKKLKDFCTSITVGFVGPMAHRYEINGIPFLRSQNVRPFRIDLDDVKFIGEDFNKEIKKSELRPGDVAIVRTGYPGTAAVIPEGLPRANCADLVIARTGERLSPSFLAMFMNSEYGKRLVADKSVGSAQKHFNVTAAKDVNFAAPSIEEQDKLVELAMNRKAECEIIESHYRAKLADLDALRQALLQKAFAGELT